MGFIISQIFREETFFGVLQHVISTVSEGENNTNADFSALL